MPEFSLENLTAFSGQILLLGAAGMLAPIVLRLRQPRGLLAYHQIVLLLCLAVPWIAPWSEPRGVLIQDQPSMAGAATGENLIREPWTPSLSSIVWSVLLLGMAARLAWLAVGLRRLRKYRRTARDFDELPDTIKTPASLVGVPADVKICGELEGPVTFGVFRPLILLPESFRALSDSEQLVVACHELVHVARRDWLFHLLEEMATVGLWFHPLVWWMVARIRLAREQVVDQQVVSITGARDQYVAALLSVAGAARPDLAPAPLFLRRSHLKRRIKALLKEVPMSVQRLAVSYTAIALLLAGAVWLAVDSFPLMAAQQAPDAQGVTVEAGAPLLHRDAVEYPKAVLEQGIGGSVIVDVVPAADGTVADARVVSGRAELRRPVLESVLDWHYDAEQGLPATIRVTVAFEAPRTRVASGRSGEPPANDKARGTLDVVDVDALPALLQDRMRGKLEPFVGRPFTRSLMSQLKNAAAEVDPHVRLGTHGDLATGQRTVTLSLDTSPGSNLANIFPESTEKRIRVAPELQSSRALEKPRPMYPREARRERVQGTVKLAALVGTDGHVKDLRLIDGPPSLVESAVEAVRHWVYRPTLVNGRPVEVVTQVDVNYMLKN